jgi:hypothetical protein
MINPFGAKEKEKLFIIAGLRIGRLTVGELVRDVIHHPCYLETPTSYLKQGRLREVTCDCGQMRLISESILATNRVQSCGCLRQEIRQKSTQGKISRMQQKADRDANKHAIKIEQARLQALKLERPKNDQAIEECGARLRSLFARKAVLNRKESHKGTWKRLAQEKLNRE